MKRLISFLVIFTFLITLTIRASGQNRDPEMKQSVYKVSRISGINFDGIPDEAAWQTVDTLQMTMYRPNFGAPPTEESIIKLAYDNDFLYLSGMLFYKNPKDIRAIGKKRDYLSFAPDRLAITIDSYNDRENAFNFAVNPNGARIDGAIKNDMLVWEDINFNWNTFWDAKTVRMENGWTAEIRIPFSSLRFQSSNGITKMGIAVMRTMAATYESVSWPVLSPNFPFPAWKASLTAEVEFENLNPKKPLYVTPYIIGGFENKNILNEPKTGYDLNTKWKGDAGLDVKYNLTNNLIADLTVNTDFAQAEADAQQINLSRLSLYFPEKRNFFLEKEDVFNFSLLGNSNLFYSRNIGLYQGNPVTIYGGARLTGRVGNWDIGFLDMQTEDFQENPSENFGTLRLKRSVLNSNSFIGTMVTSRLGMNGNYNVASGFDGLFRVVGDEYLSLKWAQTFQNDLNNDAFSTEPSRFIFEWQRRNDTGFAYDLIYTWSGKTFNPGIGFEERQNFQGPHATFQYGWLPGKDAVLRYHKLSLKGYRWWSTETGKHETTTATLQWDFETKKGIKWYAAVNRHLENLYDKLIIGYNQASVPAGEYSFTDFSLNYTTSNRHALTAFFNATAGDFYDGRKWSFNTYPSLKIGSDFDLSLYYQLDFVEFSERSMEFTNHIVRFNGLMTLTTKTSVSAFIQYNSAINGIIGNIRFRYNPRDGNDFYIVYNENLNTDRSRVEPKLPFTSARTVLLKYTYTFRW
ncbi:carbohydrate binding family 9 domain-containing protein [Maribellus mangrovi]|uniref:carbohydrate binding family 9 domain-containing protein n=1 Tax=Maribellus mangrovi TaxID=3133146 RepID=UPI0030ED22D2